MKCNCGYCGKEINKQPHEIKNSKSGLVFCSKSCACSYNNSHLRSGKNNPNYIDGGYIGNSVYTRLAYRTYKHKESVLYSISENLLSSDNLSKLETFIDHILLNIDGRNSNESRKVCRNSWG